jgi:fatty acid desaturase
MNALGFVALVLAFIWVGTWALQIAAIVLVVAVRILVIIGVTVVGLITAGAMALFDPEGFRRAGQEARLQAEARAVAQDRWA